MSNRASVPRFFGATRTEAHETAWVKFVLMSTQEPSLSPDRPSSDPARDLFGHAPFARTLAKAIAGYRDAEGIVLALYGPWGSGKSTVLAYVEHELGLLDAETQPVVVTFNPWWFSGQEHLARAFLGQLQAVLPTKHAGFKELGNKLSQFSSAIGGAVDVAGAYFGVPLGGKVVEAGAKLLAVKPKDVPSLKNSISQLLFQEKKRVLVVVDDIDRLAPEETRQLFTVIKALADFPYVTYLLAFDREVASSAISQQTGLPGERYLEKIIQVPFELPRADRETLRKALFTRLDQIIARTPEGLFDPGHWQNIFPGLEPLFTVPRDVVRLTNALSVTYPAVIGEVNPVDFIALECLRVFLPSVYDSIRTAPEEFAGHKSPDEHEKQAALKFHEAWLADVPEPLKKSTKRLLQRLFPRLESVWSNMHYGGDALLPWRRKLRICAGDDIFQAYFRLSLPPGAVSKADVDALLAAATDPSNFAVLLRAAKEQKLSSGISKARALLERIMDFVPEEMTAEHAAPVIIALFTVGDELLLASDENDGLFGSGNEVRMARIGHHLLKKVDPGQRFELLKAATEQAQALRCAQRLLNSLVEEADKAAQAQGDALLQKAETNALKGVWVQRLEQIAATEPNFAERPGIGSLLGGWRAWGPDGNAKNWAQQFSTTDEGLIKLIKALSYQVQTWGDGDNSVRTYVRVKPQTVDNYVPMEAAAERVRVLLAAGAVPDDKKEPAQDFVRSWDAFKAGEPEED